MTLIALIFGIFLSLFISGFQVFLYKQPIPIIWHPFKAISLFLERKLNKEGRSKQDLMLRGFLMMAVILFVATIFVYILMALKEAAQLELLPSFVDGIVFALCIVSFTPAIFLFRLARRKEVDSELYLALSQASHINLIPIDQGSIMRYAIGFCNLLLDRVFLGGLFWFIALGAEMLMYYSALQAVSFYTGRYGFDNGFAFLPRVIARALHIPGQLLYSALMILVSVVSPGLKLSKALSVKGEKPSYAVGGLSLLTLARATGIGLGGPLQSIDSKAYPVPWVGEGKIKASMTPAQGYICAIALGLIVLLALAFSILLLFY